MLGFGDIILELNHFGRIPIDNRRRKLIGLSRYEATPTRLYYEWEPATSAFRVLQDPHMRRFQDNWPRIRKLLERYKVEVSHKELLQAWPEDSDKHEGRMASNCLFTGFEIPCPEPFRQAD